MNPIRIGILGYGNLGRGIELAVAANDDMELVGVFTRRDPGQRAPARRERRRLARHGAGRPYRRHRRAHARWAARATDLPEQTPAAAALYNVVDSFDTHANIPAHFAAVDAVAREAGHVAVISVGWDPGMFSVSRVYANAIMPNGADYTFWGRGVSQGHSDAIRRIPGRGRRPPVHGARARGAGCRALRRQPGADHAPEAHPRVLRCGRGGRRYGRHRKGHRHDAELLRRLRHHGHLHFSGRARPRSRRHSPRRLGHPHRHHGCRPARTPM